MAATFRSIGGFEEGEDWPQYVEYLTFLCSKWDCRIREKMVNASVSNWTDCIKATVDCYFPCEARRDFPRAGHSYDGAP